MPSRGAGATSRMFARVLFNISVVPPTVLALSSVGQEDYRDSVPALDRGYPSGCET